MDERFFLYALTALTVTPYQFSYFQPTLLTILRPSNYVTSYQFP